MKIDGKIYKLVLFKNNIETLGYFSEQMARTFRELGYEVYMFDYNTSNQAIIDLIWFCEAGKTAMITFNFIGLGVEDEFFMNDGELFWNQRNVLCLNILVDHPFYYDKDFKNLPDNYKMFCIDKDHVEYVRRFYKEAKSVEFLPLAGTEINVEDIPYNKRKYDIIFTGNYTPPNRFEKYINRIDSDYAAFYWKIISELLANTDMTMEQAMMEYLKLEMPDISEQDMKTGMSAMIFIDLYVRFYFRGEVLKSIIDSGHVVHVFGRGWDMLECKHSENLICHGSIESYECICHMKNAKISLNIMPWFKNGGHDRIFNTMLSKAVCISDGSKYMDTQYKENEDYVRYSLARLDELPGKIDEVLYHDDIAAQMAQLGYNKTIQCHTWAHRACELAKWLNKA